MRLALRIRQHPIAGLIAWFLVTFLVLFPKGGFKVGGIPLTWGYLMMGMSAFPLVAIRLITVQLKVSRQLIAAILSVLPFQIIFIFSYLQNGVDSVGYAISTFVGFFILPFLFFVVYPPFLGLIDGLRFRRYLSFCIFVAATYGIFLFVWHPITGSYIEIPFLTVNVDDYGLLESTKHIDRGAFLKLISTYNNGNVYGVATLILLPLYDLLEKNRWKRVVVKIALVLTLSRTVWAGLIFEQALSFAAQIGRQVPKFPKFQYAGLIQRGLLVFATLALVLAGVVLNGTGLDFILDSSLGGRGEQLQAFLRPTFLPGLPLTGFSEMVYSSALSLYGVTGFLAIVLIFMTPIVMMVLDPEVMRDPVKRSALKGLILYAAVAAIDGATDLIPIMTFYWFAYMTFLMGLPGQTSEVRNNELSRPI
jgi:hypothetical protein